MSAYASARRYGEEAGAKRLAAELIRLGALSAAIANGASADEADTFAQAMEYAFFEASGGRALCLFTSHRALRELSALVAPRLRDYRVLVQGQAPRERLLEAFRNDVTSVLFATSSFWQGVDVRGESLSCVIIDKLPFAVPSDPLVAGRCERIERDGGSSFAEYSVPHAALMLRQGFGRLLRAESDRGVVALLDGRVRRARYGRDLLAALPPAPITDSIEDVRAFFAGEGLASESLYAEVL